jgi:hypothetical protein
MQCELALCLLYAGAMIAAVSTAVEFLAAVVVYCVKCYLSQLQHSKSINHA